MIQTIELQPGITLRCFPEHRLRHGCLSIQLLRPMCREEASLNALLPAVLLRGTRQNPDLRSITLRLDTLYGASVSPLVRRVGDCQTTGLYASFIEDRFAMEGDEILAPMVAFLKELLLDPDPEDGCFRRDYVESEKRNLISTIESELNDKRVYAMTRMIRLMCREDSYGVPRLGDKEHACAVTPESLYAHYRRILRESPVNLFYVGSAPAEQIADLLRPMFAELERDYQPFSGQSAFRDCGGCEKCETMPTAQSQLCMGFTSSIHTADPEFAAMQVFNAVFGGSMTSKLFQNVREKLSLCYTVGSSYVGLKGLVTVSAGIDAASEELARKEILAQLEACQQGAITDEELTAAKQALISTLRSVHDSAGAVENYYSTAAVSGLAMTPAEYMAAVEAVSAEQTAAAAQTVQLHTVLFLKGVGA